jgi:NDP-sugar pyrophosphorylase family protein
MSKRAVILAGGKGSRLRPYTVVLPKPLMPIGDYPILEVIVMQLSKNGFTHITLAVNHQADIIKAYFGNGEKWGLRIDYSFENKPLSTMAPLKLIDDLPENFLVMNGDVLCDLDFVNFYNLHSKRDENFTISAFKRSIKSEFGVLKVDSQQKLTNFEEKPISEYLVSMGIYMLNRRVLDMIPEGVAFGFDDLMYEMIKSETKPYVEVHSGYWLDIGRPDDYVQAIDEFDSIKEKIL